MLQVANNNVHILNYCYEEGLIKRKLVCITQYYYLQQVGNTDNAGGRTVYIPNTVVELGVCTGLCS